MIWLSVPDFRRCVMIKLLPVLASCLLIQPAFAGAALQKSSPAAGARVASPVHVTLHFSQALEPAFSGALLLDSDGRNVTGAPVKIDGTEVVMTPGPLAPGVYHVAWHSVGHDTHRLEGEFSFTVK
jgi:methionine-rich copper-binding protein CopC